MYGLSIVFADNGELIELLDNGVKGDVLCIIDLVVFRLFDYFGPAFFVPMLKRFSLLRCAALPNRNYINQTKRVDVVK